MATLSHPEWHFYQHQTISLL